MRKTVCLLGVLALLVAAAAGPARGAAAPRPAQLLAAAQKLYDQGQHDEAQRTLAELETLAPAYPGAAELGTSVAAAIRRRAAAPAAAAAFAGVPLGKAAGPPPDIAVAVAAGMMDTVRKRPTPPRDPKRIYEHAEAMVAKGLYDSARRLLAQIQPDDEEFDRARMLRARIDAWEARDHTKDRGVGPQMDKYLKGKLRRDLTAARGLFNAGKWREAQDACLRIQTYAPDDARVRRLLEDARIELTAVDIRDLMSEGEESMLEMLGEVEKASSPPFYRVKLTRPKLEPDERVMTADEIALEKKLNEKVSIDLMDAQLSYVLDLLARAVGVNIIVDPGAVQDKTVTINVQNTSLKEVLDFITRHAGVSYTRGKSTLYVTTPDQPMLTLRIFHLNKGLTDYMQDITKVAKSQQQGRGQQQPQQQQQQQPTGAKPSQTSDIERLLEEIEMGLIDWPTGSRYYLDRKRNVLFLRSTAETLDTVERMIKALDENPVQVLITTRFIEVDAENFDDIGVNWNLTNNYPLNKTGGEDKLVIDAATGSTFDPRVATEADDTVSSADGLTFGLTGILTRLQFQATLKTVKSKYKGRVVNAPAVIAMNNQAAKFMQSEDLWYVSDYRIDRTDLTGAEGVTTSEPIVVPEFTRDAAIGFSLTVTPSVGKDSRDISLLIEPIFRRKSLDSITQTVILPEGMQGEDVITIERPVVIDRRMWVKVTVRDGHHVVLGGMVTATKKEIEAKIPVLGDIPLLGWLFKRKTTRYVRKNLLIFVSARILDARGYKYKTEAEEMTEALRQAELLRGKPGPNGLPPGARIEAVRAATTRQVVGQSDAAPRRETVTDLKEFSIR